MAKKLFTQKETKAVLKMLGGCLKNLDPRDSEGSLIRSFMLKLQVESLQSCAIKRGPNTYILRREGSEFVLVEKREGREITVEYFNAESMAEAIKYAKFVLKGSEWAKPRAVFIS